MSNKNITSLTAEQQARFPEFIEKWTDIGLSTAPADRAAAELGIRKAYEAAGKKPPRIVWTSSPLAQGLTRAIVEKLSKKPAHEVGKNIEASVRDSVRDSVGDSVRDSVWDSVGDSVRDSVWDSGYGAHDAGWLSFYDFFREVVGLREITAPLEPLTELARHVGWWLPHEKICWVSERHTLVRKDASGRLHCETGPAVAYPDGFAVYAWHGVRIDGRIIDNPETITVKEIDDERNAEVRRVLMERFGTGRYLLEGGAKEMHRDECGILYRKDFAGDEPLVMVRVLNSTPEPDGVLSAEEARQIFGAAAHRVTDGRYKEYQIRVPPTVKTAREAVAWTVDVRPEDYRPEVES